jgi:hypothetical protein
MSGAALRGAELENSRLPAPICDPGQLSSPPDSSSPGGVPFDGERDDEQTLFETSAMALRLVTVDAAPEMTRSILDTSIEKVVGKKRPCLCATLKSFFCKSVPFLGVLPCPYLTNQLHFFRDHHFL